MADNAAMQYILTGKVDPKIMIVSGATSFVCAEGIRNAAKVVTPKSMAAISAKAQGTGAYSFSKSGASGFKGGVKTDFYVTPSGTAVPSTGQRYFARNPELLKRAKDGVLPARSNGMYFSFDKIDDAIVAQGKLQIPYRPEYRVSFDTLQIIDDIKIPKGDWGRASYLEPLTKDFMQYGPGKATQVITNSPVNVSDIYKLRR